MGNSVTVNCPIDWSSYANSNICCFAAGTRIGTASGDVPVESLQEGDVVLSHDGTSVKVRWIGRRRLSFVRAAHGQPIRISRGAIAESVPCRDLIVSPEHGISFGGTLIPAKLLVNETTVGPVALTEVTYYHVECERHSIILAEGAPLESFLDTGLNARFFSNGSGVTQLHVDETVGDRAPGVARWRNWIVARTSGIGVRAYNLFSALGARPVGQVFLNLSLHLIKHIQGACAPRAYFGEAVDNARRMMKAREAELVADTSASRLKRIA